MNARQGLGAGHDQMSCALDGIALAGIAFCGALASKMYTSSASVAIGIQLSVPI